MNSLVILSRLSNFGQLAPTVKYLSGLGVDAVIINWVLVIKMADLLSIKALDPFLDLPAYFSPTQTWPIIFQSLWPRTV